MRVTHVFVLLVAITVFSILVMGCGGEKAVEERSTTTEMGPAEKSPVGESEKVPTQAIRGSEAPGSMGEIAVGSLPEGFPTDMLPLYPGGSIDRSAKNPGEFTVLQTAPDSEDKIYGFYKAFYEGKNWKTTSKVTVAGRTMAGFSGPDKRVDMTLKKANGGGTFFSLVLVEE